MKKKILFLTLSLLLGNLTSIAYSANNFRSPHLMGANSAVYFDKLLNVNSTVGMTVKSGGAYNESDDPLYRRGTQNTDTPQGMFLVIPVSITVIFFVVLFLKKK